MHRTDTPEGTRTVLRSDELTCPSCVRKIERALNARDGVVRSEVHVATGRIEVDHDPSRIDAEQLVDVVRSVGYAATRAPF